MATRVDIILIDDIDGGAADETVHFALDGTGYEIDVSASNASALRSLLAPYIAAGRKTKGTAGAAAKKSGAGRLSAPGAFRRWAIENGYEVSSHGIIPGRIAEAFQAANT